MLGNYICYSQLYDTIIVEWKLTRNMYEFAMCFFLWKKIFKNIIFMYINKKWLSYYYSCRKIRSDDFFVKNWVYYKLIFFSDDNPRLRKLYVKTLYVLTTHRTALGNVSPQTFEVNTFYFSTGLNGIRGQYNNIMV